MTVSEETAPYVGGSPLEAVIHARSQDSHRANEPFEQRSDPLANREEEERGRGDVVVEDSSPTISKSMINAIVIQNGSLRDVKISSYSGQPRTGLGKG